MIKSMTGYGKGEVFKNDRRVVVEIKSVNHRYSDISFKMPRVFNFFEDTMRKKVQSFMQRGKIDIYVTMESFRENDTQIKLNETLAKNYIEALEVLQKKYLPNAEISLQMVANYSDVLTLTSTIDSDDELCEMKDTLDEALSEALKNMIDMRKTEGENLKSDLFLNINLIEPLLSQIKIRQPQVIVEYKARIASKIREMLETSAVDEARLLTEVAIFADKTGIDEETTRFSSHLSQFKQVVSNEENIGKKLDFIVQEMNREINTIGSKSNDIGISKIVVDLKCYIEKIREQIQNIE